MFYTVCFANIQDFLNVLSLSKRMLEFSLCRCIQHNQLGLATNIKATDIVLMIHQDFWPRVGEQKDV